MNLFSSKVRDDIIIYREGSYNRLHEFMLDRHKVKKAIMTIPYNVSLGHMKIYVKDIC